MKTDEAAQQDVVAELHCEPPAAAAQIDVEVKDAIAPLTGHVRSYAEQWDSARRLRPDFGKRERRRVIRS